MSSWSGWCVLGTASVMMSFSYTDDRVRKTLRDMFMRLEQTFRGDERGSALMGAVGGARNGPSSTRIRPSRRSSPSLTAAPRARPARRARSLFSWGHPLRKTVCFSMCRESAEWGHFLAKSFVISTNGLIQNGPRRLRPIKGLQWQTLVRGDIGRQRLFWPVANLPAPVQLRYSI